ncbi:hypothetical protein [Aliivibrio fischeri]|uniref:hypothetical protein n=1 Tax=Aliivibrio fischeri TaxID=668 RepID=UPI0007C435B4|nr:hypothetical protein [Aliivibrio fischeri]
MIKESILINGIEYQFETKGNKTELVYDIELTDSKNDDLVNIGIPSILVVTRNSGEILFILECSEGESFEILSASSLYERKIQWFEPLADNYRKLLYVNNKDYVKAAYKLFTWNDIYEFSLIDRSSVAYRTRGSGDWKYVADGANGYILSLIDGVPYWSDAVGQIPFAIDTYRLLRNKNSVKFVGGVFAEGNFSAAIKSLITGELDKTNSWDNYFVLRGSLFAEKKFTYKVLPTGKDYPKNSLNEVITNYDVNNLSKPITKIERDKYL